MFDLSPEEFFYTLVYTFTRFRSARAKERTDLLYLIMGLNHLREWIAPGYKYSPSIPAKTPNEVLFGDIFNNCPEWQIMRELFNVAKHEGNANLTSVQYGLPISDWPNFSGVVKFSNGSPSEFYFGTRNMVEIFETVISFYQDHWFRSQDIALLLNTRS